MTTFPFWSSLDGMPRMCTNCNALQSFLFSKRHNEFSQIFIKPQKRSYNSILIDSLPHSVIEIANCNRFQLLHSIFYCHSIFNRFTATKILREDELNHIILRKIRKVFGRIQWAKLIGLRPVACYRNFTFPYQSMIILNVQLVNSFNFFNISTAVSAESVSVKQLCLQEFVKIFVSDFQNLLIITTIKN